MARSRALWRQPAARVGAALIFAVLCIAYLGPWLAPYAPDFQFPDALDPVEGLPASPSARFWLGADHLGRDELSRLLHGGRVSMTVALLATAAAATFGLTVGLITGFVGGAVDYLAMRAIDVLLSLPFLLVAIALNRVIDNPGQGILCAILALLSWMTLARVTRARVLQLRALDFVTAARALGCSPTRVLLRHVLPSALGPALVVITNMVAGMVLAESAMSYLGLGVRPPATSWGGLLHDGQGLLAHAPRLVILPGLLIVCTVFGFNLLGEALSDVYDPKKQGA